MSVHLSSQKIIKDWIDYNDHMNVAYYLLIFDKFGADTLNRMFKMGEESAKSTGMSTMIVETNITYNQEEIQESENKNGSTILYLGLASIIFVPVFKTITHLPPYVGMMFSLALVSSFAEILSSTKINITSFDDESDDAANHSPVPVSYTHLTLPTTPYV